jgi:hypothetical protein
MKKKLIDFIGMLMAVSGLDGVTFDCIALLVALPVVWRQGGWKDGDQPSFVLFSLRLFSNRAK